LANTPKAPKNEILTAISNICRQNSAAGHHGHPVCPPDARRMQISDQGGDPHFQIKQVAYHICLNPESKKTRNLREESAGRAGILPTAAASRMPALRRKIIHIRSISSRQNEKSVTGVPVLLLTLV